MKLPLITTAFIILCATAAQAQVNVDIGINDRAPAYYAPTPVYMNDRHHNYDWNYWHREPVRVVEVHDEYDDDHEHHDNGKHKGWYKNKNNRHHGRD